MPILGGGICYCQVLIHPYGNFMLFRLILEQNVHDWIYVNSVLISERGDTPALAS